MVLAERQTPNHVLHLLLTFFTGGAWLIVWIILAVFTVGPYRCPNCGSRTLGYVPRKYKETLKKRHGTLLT